MVAQGYTTFRGLYELARRYKDEGKTVLLTLEIGAPPKKGIERLWHPDGPLAKVISQETNKRGQQLYWLEFLVDDLLNALSIQYEACSRTSMPQEPHGEACMCSMLGTGEVVVPRALPTPQEMAPVREAVAKMIANPPISESTYGRFAWAKWRQAAQDIYGVILYGK